jgi:hypothetical protein
MTQDLTKITTPFGLLDAETQKALMEAHRNGKAAQIYTRRGWCDIKLTPDWCASVTYRIKPEPEPEVVSRWVNVYDHEVVVSESSRELADKYAGDDRICVLRIDYCDGDVSFHKEEN